MIKSTYGMFSDPDIDLTTQKAESINSAANTKAAQLGSSSDMAALGAFRQANPTASSLDEKMYLNRLAMDKAMSRNDSLLGDIATGVSIGFGDILPQTAAGAWGLVTGSQDAWDYVAKQQAEAEASREQYSIDTLQARENIRLANQVREAAYNGRERTWGEAFGDAASTIGDYITNPAAAAVEASESAADIAMMATGGGTIGALTKAGVRAAGRKKIAEAAAKAMASNSAVGDVLLSSARKGIDSTTLAAIDSLGVGAQNALRKKAINSAAQKALTKKADKVADSLTSAFGVGYTGYSEGVNNGIQTYQTVMDMDPAVLYKSEDFQEFKTANPELSGEELKKEYARSLGQSTALKSGLIAAAIGKATGASDAAANLGKGAKAGVIKTVGKGTVKEGVEEFGQSGSGQLMSNIDVAKADESKDILEGVGHAAAAGMMSGGLMGAATGAATKVAPTTGDILKATPKAAKATVDYAGSVVKAASDLFKSDDGITKESKDILDRGVDVSEDKDGNLVSPSARIKAVHELYTKGDIKPTSEDNVATAEVHKNFLSDQKTELESSIKALPKSEKDLEESIQILQADLINSNDPNDAASIQSEIDSKKSLVGNLDVERKAQIKQLKQVQSAQAALNKWAGTTPAPAETPVTTPTSGDTGTSSTAKPSSVVNDELTNKYESHKDDIKKIAVDERPDVITHWARNLVDITNAEDKTKAVQYRDAMETLATQALKVASNSEDPEQQERFKGIAERAFGASATIESRVLGSPADIDNFKKTLQEATKPNASTEVINKVTKEAYKVDLTQVDDDTLDAISRSPVVPWDVSEGAIQEKQIRSTISSVTGNFKSGGFSTALGREVDGIDDYLRDYATAKVKGDAEAAATLKGKMANWIGSQESKVAALTKARDSIQATDDIEAAYNVLNAERPRGSTEGKWAPPEGASKALAVNSLSKLIRSAESGLDILRTTDSQLGEVNKPAKKVEKDTSANPNIEMVWSNSENAGTSSRKLKKASVSKGNYELVLDNPLGRGSKEATVIVNGAGKILSRRSGTRTSNYSGPSQVARITPESLKHLQDTLGVLAVSENQNNQQDSGNAQVPGKQQEGVYQDDDTPPWDADNQDGTSKIPKVTGHSIIDTGLHYGFVVKRDGIYFYTDDAEAAKHNSRMTTLGLTTQVGGYILVNEVALSDPKKVLEYFEDISSRGGAQKAEMLKLMGITPKQFMWLFSDDADGNVNPDALKDFIIKHEQSHIKNNDKAAYPRVTGTKELDLMDVQALAIEARVTMDALTPVQRSRLSRAVMKNIKEGTVPSELTLGNLKDAVHTALQNKSYGYSDNEVAVYGAILDSLPDNTTVTFFDATVVEEGGYTGGTHLLDNGVHVIRVPVNTSKGSPLNTSTILDTLLHEMDHAKLVESVIADATAENTPQRYKELQKVFKAYQEYLKDNPDHANQYIHDHIINEGNNRPTGMKEAYQLSEFITVSRTHPAMRAYLSKIPLKDSKKNVFAKLLDIILAYFSEVDPNNLTAYAQVVGIAHYYQQQQDISIPTPSDINNLNKGVKRTRKAPPVNLGKLQSAGVLQISSNGEMLQLKIQSAKAKGSGTFEVTVFDIDGKTPLTLTVKESGIVYVGGKKTDARIYLPDPKEEHWATNLVNKVTEISGLKVTRFKDNFVVNTHSGSLLARRPDLFGLNFGSWDLDHPRNSEFETSKSIQDFKGFLDTHAETIRKSIENSVNGSLAFNNWLHDLVHTDATGNVDVPAEVVTAVAASMFSFMLVGARDTGSMTLSDHTAALERVYAKDGDSIRISKELSAELRTAGVHQASLVYDLGNTAISALGLVTSANAMLNARENMKNSLGMATLAALEDTGLVIGTKPKGSFTIVKKNGLTQEGATLPTYYRASAIKFENGIAVRTPEGRIALDATTEQWIANNRAEKNLLDSIFANQRSTPLPSTTPQDDKLVRKAGNSGKGIITEAAKDLANKKEKVPHIIQPRVQALMGLGEETFRNLIRKVSGYDENTDAHIDIVATSTGAVNQLIDRTIDNLYDLKDSLEESGTFFYNYNFHVNHREGQGTSLSMQGNKVARNMITPEAWITEITRGNLNNIPRDQNDPVYQFFKGVGQGLGVEEQSYPDPNTYIKAVRAKLNTPAIKAAIPLLGKASLTTEDVDTIAAAVKEGGEKTHSFLALLEYSGYVATPVGGMFTTSIYVENDAKTSALAIASGQLSTQISVEALQRVGIFTKADEGIDQLSTFGQFTGDDSYYAMANILKDVLPNIKGLEYFYGALLNDQGRATKSARQLVKFATMTPMYGAGTPAVVRQMLGDEIVPKALTMLNSISDPHALVNWLANFNELLPAKYALLNLPIPNNVRDAQVKFGSKGYPMSIQNFHIPNFIFEKMVEKFVEQFEGREKHHSNALNRLMGSAVDSQKDFGDMVNMMGQLYMLQYQSAVDAKMVEKHAEAVANGYSGNIDKYKNNFTLTIQELNKIESDLRELLPAIPDALYSEKDSEVAKLVLMNEDTRIAPVKDNHPYRIGAHNGTISGIEHIIAARISGAAALATHALDAAIALATQATNKDYTATLNVHDANASGIKTAHSLTNELNKNFYEKAIAGYSYFDKAFERFEHIAANVVLNDKNKIFIYVDGQLVGIESNEQLDHYVAGFRVIKDAILQNQKNLTERVFSVDNYTTSPFIVREATDTAEVIDNISRAPVPPSVENLKITPKTMLEVFSILGTGNTKDSVEHTKHLVDTMMDIAANGMEDIEVVISKHLGQDYHTISATDMMINNMRQGPNRYARKERGAISMSAQEFYVNELAYAVGGYWVDNSTLVRDEIKNIYTYARKAAEANPTLWAKHSNLFNNVFKPSSVMGKSDYLQNFFSSAVSNEGMRELLSTVEVPLTKSDWFKGDTLLEKIANFFNTMVMKLRGKAVKASSIQGDQRLSEVLRHITTLDANHRSLAKSILDKLGTYTDGRFSFVNKPLVAFLKKPTQLIHDSNSRLVKAIGLPVTLTSAVLGDLSKLPTARLIKDWSSQAVFHMIEHNNVLVRELGTLLTSAAGRSKRNSDLIEVFHATKQSADKARMQILPRVAKVLRESFDPAIKLTDANKKALTYVLAKADLSSLTDLGNNIGHTFQLVSNDALRAAEIARVTADLTKLVGNDSFYRMQAQNLGWMMVDGNGTGLQLPRFNAYAIAQGRSGKDPVDPKVEKLVDQLASLYALDTIPADMRREADSIIQHEMGRVDEDGQPIIDNGVLNTLYTLKSTRNDAMINLFKGAENLMQKGYIGDKFPSRMEMAFSTSDADPTLLAKGYTLYSEVGYDPTSGHTGKRYLYTSPYGGLAKFETGAFVLDAKHSRGTDVTPPKGVTEHAMNSQMTAAKTAMDNVTYATGSLKIKRGNKVAVPKWDTQGNITGYRMVMSESLKDSLMQRDTDIFNIVADLRASAHIKGISQGLNSNVLNALKTTYDRWGQSSPNDFVFIGPKSTRKIDRDYWATLPHETQQEAIRLFGSRGIPVRRNARDIAFGTREWAITDIWNKPHQDRRLIEKVVYNVATQFFGAQAAIKLSKATDIMQTLGRISKDAIVIKSFITTVGNTLSNIMLNMAHGINPYKQLKLGSEAYIHAARYLKNSSRLVEINTLRTNTRIGASKLQALLSEEAMIKEDMRISPVRSLIESGALQNIEEIVREEGEATLYKELPLIGKVADAYGKVVTDGSLVDKVIKNSLVMQGSSLYNNLRVAAQMSDFVAKYAYVQSRVKDTKNPMSEKLAVQQANDLFIDYLLPSGVIMTTLNNLGFLYFTKYLIRVQKTILTTISANPVRSLMILMGADWLNVAPSIFGSFMDNPLNRLDNPVSMFVGAMDEPIVANMLL